MIDSSHLAFEHLNESLVIKMHYLLHPPCSKRETGTWGHHEATNLTGQTHIHKDWQMDCATDSAEERFTTLREQTNPSRNTFALQPYSLTFQLCPHPQETVERTWDRTRVKNQER